MYALATSYTEQIVALSPLLLDERDDGSEIQSYLFDKTGQRTVPNIFINKQHIGGCDSVIALKEQGKLSALVKA
ncbi:Glutaredoxin-C6 [Cerrena zonata]|uniref:Glutaredoxin-C6 n=1 Tax=Cerrena zonata TaxID=2478898 RepID=A0AAW0G6T7_9APHY